jgi:hypothetical protein
MTVCKAKASRLGIKRRPGAWQPWELVLLEDISIPLTEVAERTGRKLGSVYAEASIRKISRLVSPEVLCLLRETDMSYTKIAEITGTDRESVRKVAYYRGVANRGQPTGADAHKWRGGSKRAAPTWRGPDWPEFRQAALERDGYTCQDCGFVDFTGEKLHVHHIIPWRLRPVNEMRWLTTLCLRCHGKRPEHDWLTIPTHVEELLAVV